MATQWSTGRTEAFSDGVFAIAITLLVLEISVPEQDFDDLLGGIVDQWPSYLGYVTSFVTVGAIWLAHHGLFARLRHVDVTVMRLNLLLLMLVSFLPFPTRLMAEAIHDEDAERVAVVFYGAALLAISTVMGALWRTVSVRHHLLRDEVDRDEVARRARDAVPNVGAYVVVALFAFAFPQLAAFGYLVIALALVLRAHGDDTAAEATAG